MTIEKLVAELGIAEAPEYWQTHWAEYQDWKSSGGCGVEPGEIVGDAYQVFDLPRECIPQVEDVCAVIRANPVLTELAGLWHYLLFHMPDTRALGEDVLASPVGILGERAPLFHVAVLVSDTEDALQAFRMIGVSDQIALDSLMQCGSQLVDYHQRCGVYGMKYLGWMRNYFNAKMFRLGRLVFNSNTYTWGFHVYRNKTTGELKTLLAAGNKYRTDGLADGCNGILDPDAWTSEMEVVGRNARGNPVVPDARADRETVTLDLAVWEPIITPGDSMIEIHIPPASSGGRMAWEECAASYREALDFFPIHYPELNFSAFTCWSWLLDPSLSKILPPESNIVKFQSPFHLLPVCSNDAQCYDLVFGDGAAVSTVTPKTSLQRAIVDYVCAGNRMRGAAGFITMEEMDALVR